MSSLHIVSAEPSLLTEPRVRAAYSEGAGIYRILPRAVAVPGSVAELDLDRMDVWVRGLVGA